MKILIADDAGALTARGTLLLSGWGHEIETAVDGLEALRAARRWQPDVILAKVHLPRMDGFSLSSAIRAGTETRCIAVLLAGPPEDEYSRRHAEISGAFAYLSTPLSVTELQRALGRLRVAEEEPPGVPRRRAARANPL